MEGREECSDAVYDLESFFSVVQFRGCRRSRHSSRETPACRRRRIRRSPSMSSQDSSGILNIASFRSR